MGPLASARVSTGRWAPDRLSRRRIRTEVVWEDQAAVKVADAVGCGDEFEFRFDFGAGFRHRCRVLADKADPREALGPGALPSRPTAIWGWGSIPDQYGRETADEGDD